MSSKIEVKEKQRNVISRARQRAQCAPCAQLFAQMWALDDNSRRHGALPRSDVSAVVVLEIVWKIVVECFELFDLFGAVCVRFSFVSGSNGGSSNSGCSVAPDDG